MSKLKVIKIPLKDTNSLGVPYVPDRALEYQLNLYGESIVQVIPVQEAVSSSLSVTTFILIVDQDKSPVRIPTKVAPKPKTILNEGEKK